MHRQWIPAWSVVVLGCAVAGTSPPAVRPGIDVLLSDSLHLVRGERVGLLTNQTGVDGTGKGDAERLREAGVRLTALFSPEHGLRGVLDQQNIGNAVDSATGLPVYSLYGNTRAPAPAMLAQVDVILVDLQSIGSRTWTYTSTMLLTLQAAAAAGKRVIVLDRPNPIGGVAVQGPVLDTAFASFVGMLPLPLRHGMTLGELARFGAARLGLSEDLRVVPVAGWRRAQWLDQTGLPWVQPSPNMPSLESAAHYPGIVVFEGTNLSVGRGTPIAFQVIGAPWLDPARVLGILGEVPGVAVRDTTITPHAPGDGKYADLTVPALSFRVTDRATYDPTRLAARLLWAIHQVHPGQLTFDRADFDRLAGNDTWRHAVESGRDGDEVWGSWRAGLEAFRKERAAFLLYR